MLDKVHWFSGPSKGDPGLQRDLVVTYADTMLRKNATQALNEQRPLIYKEALEEARACCQALNCEESLLLTEHLGGRQSGKGGANLNAPVNTGRGGGRGRGSSRSGGSGGQRTGGGANLNAAPTQSAYGSVDDLFKQREKMTCVHWNLRRCKNEYSCDKLHQCSMNLGNGRICWDKVKQR